MKTLNSKTLKVTIVKVYLGISPELLKVGSVRFRMSLLQLAPVLCGPLQCLLVLPAGLSVGAPVTSRAVLSSLFWLPLASLFSVCLTLTQEAKVVTYLGSLAQLCCGEEGHCKQIPLACGECSQCMHHGLFSPRCMPSGSTLPRLQGDPDKDLNDLDNITMM